MYEIIKGENSKSRELLLEGNLTIRNTVSVKEALLQLLNEPGQVIISHEKGTEFDYSYLQLLISAQKSAVAAGIEFELSNRHPESFIKLVKESGCPSYSWMAFTDEIGALSNE